MAQNDERQDVDRYAVASLGAAVLSVVTLAFVPMRIGIAAVPTLSVAAIVLGVLAVRRMGINGAGGRALATAGFIIGGVCLVLFIFLLVAGAISGGASASGPQP